MSRGAGNASRDSYDDDPNETTQDSLTSDEGKYGLSAEAAGTPPAARAASASNSKRISTSSLGSLLGDSGSQRGSATGEIAASAPSKTASSRHGTTPGSRAPTQSATPTPRRESGSNASDELGNTQDLLESGSVKSEQGNDRPGTAGTRSANSARSAAAAGQSGSILSASGEVSVRAPSGKSASGPGTAQTTPRSPPAAQDDGDDDDSVLDLLRESGSQADEEVAARPASRGGASQASHHTRNTNKSVQLEESASDVVDLLRESGSQADEEVTARPASRGGASQASHHTRNTNKSVHLEDDEAPPSARSRSQTRTPQGGSTRPGSMHGSVAQHSAVHDDDDDPIPDEDGSGGGYSQEVFSAVPSSHRTPRPPSQPHTPASARTPGSLRSQHTYQEDGEEFADSPRANSNMGSARPPRPGTAGSVQRSSQRQVTLQSGSFHEGNSGYGDGVEGYEDDGFDEVQETEQGLEGEDEYEQLGIRQVSVGDDASWDGALSHHSRLHSTRSGRPQSARFAVGDSQDRSVRSSGASARSASAPRTRARPASAFAKPTSMLDEVMTRPAESWDVRDVCQWVEYVGLGQYRKKFAHNCVDGRLLLDLTDDQLKLELGIGPLGHRVALLNLISNLAAETGGDGEGGGSGSPPPRRSGRRPFSAPQEHPRRPASASRGVLPPENYLGPAAGRMTVHEQRAKLLFELDRAQSRALQTKSTAQTLAQTAEQSGAEVSKIKALLNDLERKYKMELTQTVGAVDVTGRIPWRPNGPKREYRAHPERFANVRDHPAVDETFQPRINRTSKKIIKESYGADAQGADFLNRLANDLKKRERNKKETEKKYYSQEALFGDPALAKKRFNRDFEFLSEYFALKYAMRLSESPGEYEAEINQVLEEDRAGLKLNETESQFKSLLNKEGPKKISAMAAHVRTLQFMDRYQSELNLRNGRQKELERKWWERSVPATATSTYRESQDLKQCDMYFAQLGWRGDEDSPGATDERLNALVMRGLAYRAEYDRLKEIERTRTEGPQQNYVEVIIDWEQPKWRNDGLQALQEAEWERQAADLATSEQSATARQAAGDPSTYKTPHAPPGTITISSADPSFKNHLAYTVALLGRSRPDDLEKLLTKTKKAKRVAVYRAVRTQKFLEFTETDLKDRDRKMQQAYEALEPSKRLVSQEELDDFYDRLLNDAYKRREKLERAMHDKMAKEKEILGSSALYSAKRRPASAR